MSTHVTTEARMQHSKKGHQNDVPVEFFSISTRKFFLLGICTVGFYSWYWFYRNWNIVKEHSKENIWPLARGMLSIFFCYPLFKRIFALARPQGYRPLFSPGWLAAGYILLSLAFWRLPDPWWIVGICSFIPLFKAQEAINYSNKRLYPRSAPENTFTRTEKIIMAIGALLLAMALFGLFLPG